MAAISAAPCCVSDTLVNTSVIGRPCTVSLEEGPVPPPDLIPQRWKPGHVAQMVRFSRRDRYRFASSHVIARHARVTSADHPSRHGSVVPSQGRARAVTESRVAVSSGEVYPCVSRW